MNVAFAFLMFFFTTCLTIQATCAEFPNTREFGVNECEWQEELLAFRSLENPHVAQAKLDEKSADSETRIKFDWSKDVSQQWIGRQFWQNSYRDWRQANGRIEVTKPGGDRSAVMTAHAISSERSFDLKTRMGVLQSAAEGATGWGGFKLGLRGRWMHPETWQNQMVTSHGIPAGITSDGRLFIQHVEIDAPRFLDLDDVVLALSSRPDGDSTVLTLTASPGNESSNEDPKSVELRLPATKIKGMFALTSHNGVIDKDGRFDGNKTNGKGKLAHWFDELEVSGPGIIETPERQFGPIAFNQFVVSSGTLRMNAQLTPLDIKYTDSITLEVKDGAEWQKVADGKYNQPSCTSLFVVPQWATESDTQYRIVWRGTGFDGKPYVQHYGGVVKAEPTDCDVVMGSFNCMYYTGFPYADSVGKMQKISPDILTFTGDQLYEGAGGYGCIFGPYEDSRLNYFQHWYLHGLAFKELLATTPSITINDDHDVFHGNIWGEGGKAVDPTKKGAAALQDSGGFKMYPEFVNLVQKSQCGHLPPSPSAAPVKQGIETYYTDVRFAGISFAVLEDRKWKSAPKNIHLDTEVFNGFFKDPAYAADTKKVRMVSAKAELLGKRQEHFLENWSADWSGEVWMKCVISQTVFNTAATEGLNTKLPWERYADKNFPDPGEWPDNATKPSHDMDANGWPQVARDRAVHLIRKAFAPHIAGDQHLGSMIRYGLDEYDSGSVAFCVPAASTGWSRLWMPKTRGVLDDSFIGRLDGEFSFAPENYCGKFHDGQGNKFTVLAAANPQKQTKRKPNFYYDRNPGYGVVKFHRQTHDITMTAWPAWAGPGGEGDEGQPYAGWPVTIKQTDNYDRTAKGYLPTVVLKNNPVVQVINDTTGEIEYTIRPAGKTFQPKVFDQKSKYTLRIGNPDTNVWKISSGLTPEVVAKTSKLDSLRQMNVIFFLVDDMGWTDGSCLGSSFYETPNLDQLASEGIRFTRAYAAHPVCGPSRFSLMTGKLPLRGGLSGVHGKMAEKEETLAEAFQQAGYKTFFAGKWHLGDSQSVVNQGFETNVMGGSNGMIKISFPSWKESLAMSPII